MYWISRAVQMTDFVRNGKPTHRGVFGDVNADKIAKVHAAVYFWMSSQQIAFTRPAAADRLSWATNRTGGPAAFLSELGQFKQSGPPLKWELNRRLGLAPRRSLSVPYAN